MEDRLGAGFATVVKDDDFVGDAAKILSEVQMLEGGCDAAFLVGG